MLFRSGHGAIALDYGNLSLETALETGLPFFTGFAHEAIARANWVLGNLDDARAALASAEEYLDLIPAEDDKALLRPDLVDLSAKING